MKQLQWLMAVSIAFSLVLFFLSVFAEDPWEDHVYNKAPPIAAGMLAPHLDGRERMTCSSCHEIIANNPNSGIASTPPLVAGTPPVPSHADGRDQMPCANCHRILHPDQPPATMPAAPAPAKPAAVMSAPIEIVQPDTNRIPVPQHVALPQTSQPPRTPAAAALDPEWHERFIPTRFQGKIVRIVENSVQSGRINTHILVYDGINQAAWINLAPDWYLNQQGCHIGVGLFVKGTAFKETGSKQDALRYARSFSVNGQFCMLRDKHLRGAWTRTDLKSKDEE
ncbi:Magnetosome protein MamX [Candidatus Magnetaquicoccaceae bacterium FCR-1]|uniref:Magnetosome protein MamX n=2 Tax=Candidatus Magnetaquiglobus chichijimensis TaxID=3141448 RepID=A0ABQ0CAH8_9PROT